MVSRDTLTDVTVREPHPAAGQGQRPDDGGFEAVGSGPVHSLVAGPAHNLEELLFFYTKFR